MFWWSGKRDAGGSVVDMVKEELCENVIEIRQVNDSDGSCVGF